MDVHLPRLFKTILQLLNLKIETQLRQIDFEDIGNTINDDENVILDLISCRYIVKLVTFEPFLKSRSYLVMRLHHFYPLNYNFNSFIYPFVTSLEGN